MDRDWVAPLSVYFLVFVRIRTQTHVATTLTHQREEVGLVEGQRACERKPGVVFIQTERKIEADGTGKEQTQRGGTGREWTLKP